MYKYFILGLACFGLTLSISRVEARIKYQDKSPYTCTTCHERNLKELTDEGLYFYLNGLRMSGWKPRKETKDKEVQLLADIRLSMKIAKLAEKKNKNATAIAYLKRVLSGQANWKGKSLSEFKQAQKLRFKLEKDVNKLLAKAEKNFAGKTKKKVKGMELYAQIFDQYNGLELLRLPQRQITAETRKDPDLKKRWQAYQDELRRKKVINEIDELIEKGCYLTARERIDKALRKAHPEVAKKVTLLKAKLEEPKIAEQLKADELEEVAHKDFEALELLLAGSSRNKKQKAIKMLQGYMVKYRGTLHETRALDFYEKVIDGQYDNK